MRNFLSVLHCQRQHIINYGFIFDSSVKRGLWSLHYLVVIHAFTDCDPILYKKN